MFSKIAFKKSPWISELNLLVLFFGVLIISPGFVKAEGVKFKLRNTSKTYVSVFYRISKKSGDFKLKSLGKLKPGEESIKDISIKKGDTIAFYGQNQEDQTSAIVKRDFAFLERIKRKNKDQIFYIPIVIPEQQNSSFESLENLSLQLEHNKVLSFLLKIDSATMSGFSLLEDNFQNVYPLGTFLFVDTKTNRLLVPPLEPSFWNNSEDYLTVQDSLYALVNKQNQVNAGAQVAYFLGKICSSLADSNAVELDFKGKISLLRWKPTPQADIYQIFDDKAVKSFLQNCYQLITDPDKQYQRYRLYFLSSYERIDDLEVYGRKFYNYGNQDDLSLSSNPGFQLMSSNLGLIYTKTRTLSNYYSIQNAVLHTRAYDFTSLLFNGFQNNVKAKIVQDSYAHQREVQSEILDEYQNLINYNPNPATLSLAKLSKLDSSGSLTPILITVANLTPYAYQQVDTAKSDSMAPAQNIKIAAYNSKVKIFNAHLSEINSLIKELDQVNAEVAKLTQATNDTGYAYNSPDNPGLLKEIEVSNTIIRKQ